MMKLHPSDTKASYYKIMHANTTRLLLMEDEGVIAFGVYHNPSCVDDGAEIQVAVGMTVHALKALVYSASRLIERLEEATGKTIVIDESLMRVTDEAIKRHRASVNRLGTVSAEQNETNAREREQKSEENQ